MFGESKEVEGKSVQTEAQPDSAGNAVVMVDGGTARNGEISEAMELGDMIDALSEGTIANLSSFGASQVHPGANTLRTIAAADADHDACEHTAVSLLLLNTIFLLLRTVSAPKHNR